MQSDTLFLFASTPAVYPSIHVRELPKIKSTPLEKPNEIQVDEHEKLLTAGDFDNFHLYIITTHSKFSIVPNSISIKNTNEFSVLIELSDSKERIEINFNFPKKHLPNFNLDEPVEVVPMNYSQGDILDGLSFRQNDEVFNLVFDLNFIVNHSIGLLEKKIPLLVKYIGIAEKENNTHIKRNTSDRLGRNGHEKLQQILAKLQKTPNKICSICLFKFKEANLNPLLDFSNTIKVIEASLISFFKTNEYNTQRLKFPNRSNLNREESLESIISSKKIPHFITFLSPPRNCSLYSQNKRGGNMDEFKNNIINQKYKLKDENFEYAIHVNMIDMTCCEWDFQPCK